MSSQPYYPKYRSCLFLFRLFSSLLFLVESLSCLAPSSAAEKPFKDAGLSPFQTLNKDTEKIGLKQLNFEEEDLDYPSKQYFGCLFGDSISAGVGNTLGNNNHNFARGGLSTISLIEQLKILGSTNVRCQKAIIAIGTNDAAYGVSDSLFIQNLEEAITLVKSMGATQVILIPAFYSTVAASYEPKLAGTITRVEQINALIRQVATNENVSVAASGIQPLFKEHALKQNLTKDGVHLNAEGIKIYRQALLKILNSDNPSGEARFEEKE